jgi:hypothetical protein
MWDLARRASRLSSWLPEFSHASGILRGATIASESDI